MQNWGRHLFRLYGIHFKVWSSNAPMPKLKIDVIASRNLINRIWAFPTYCWINIFGDILARSRSTLGLIVLEPGSRQSNWCEVTLAHVSPVTLHQPALVVCYTERGVNLSSITPQSDANLILALVGGHLFNPTPAQTISYTCTTCPIFWWNIICVSLREGVQQCSPYHHNIFHHSHDALHHSY